MPVRLLRRKFKEYGHWVWMSLIEEIISRMPEALRDIDIQIELRAKAGNSKNDWGEHWVRGDGKHFIYIVPRDDMQTNAEALAHELGHALHVVLRLSSLDENEYGQLGWVWRDRKSGSEVFYSVDTPWAERPHEQFAIQQEKHGEEAFARIFCGQQ